MSDSSSEELRSSEEESSEESSSEDEFEESQAKGTGGKKEREIKNMPFDEALDVSASMDHSIDADAKKSDVKNMPFDEALDVSASMSVAEPGDGDKDSTIKNKPFDEAMDIESDSSESIETNPSPRPTGSQGAPKQAQSQMQAKPVAAAAKTQNSDDDDEEESSSEEDSEDKGSGAAPAPAGAYKPEDMEHLQVSAEIRELFQYIQRYKPHTVELDHKLKCFIPDYVPSVGQIDAFLKVPRPDGQHNDLGLKLLDEPASVQSDPTVLDLQMRAISKRQHGEAAVRSIENASKNGKAIQKWIDSIVDLHRSKPLPQVHYTKNMPEIEPLMQVWPEEFEELLQEINLPGVDMDLTLMEYVKLICTIMDIPVYNNVVESLHVLFTLFSEFKSNQHFMNMGGEAPPAEAKEFDAAYDFGPSPAMAEAKGGPAMAESKGGF